VLVLNLAAEALIDAAVALPIIPETATALAAMIQYRDSMFLLRDLFIAGLEQTCVVLLHIVNLLSDGANSNSVLLLRLATRCVRGQRRSEA
jgi:hypothetical protein